MMSGWTARVVGLVWIAASAAPLFAHGDLHERIAAVTAQIERSPRQADLRVRRAELHRHHRDWDAARADLDRAAALDPALAGLDLARGRLELDAGRPDAALAALDRHVAREPACGEGRLERARARARLGRAAGASVDYAEAVRLLPDPRPDHYLEWARARAPEGPLAARAALDEGVRRLGPVVSLMLPALDQEVAAGRLDDALARIDRLAAAAPRADGWATLRGELLARAGRCDEARAAFREALRSLEAQPPPRRAARGNAELERRARAALEASDAAR